MRTGALEAVERILNRGGDPNDVLRAVVGALVARGGCASAGILLVDGGGAGLGPQAGEPRPGERMQVPVVFQGNRVAEVVADGCSDRAFLERVALLVGAHCVSARETRGVSSDQLS